MFQRKHAHFENLRRDDHPSKDESRNEWKLTERGASSTARKSYRFSNPRYEAPLGGTPEKAKAALDGGARADAAAGENAAFYAAVIRAGRCAGMRGAPRTCAALLRLALRLDPRGDPGFLLLRLDADLLAAGEYGAALALYEAPLVVAPPGAAPAFALYDGEPRPHPPMPRGAARSTTALLPGVALSRGLALLRLERRPAAVRAVADALAMFPHLLECLLDACGVDADRDRSFSYDFRDLLAHAHFGEGTREAHLKEAYDAGGLPVALDACCLRSRHLWKAPDALLLLHDGARALAERLGAGEASAATLRVINRAWATSALRKYAAAPVEEFADAFPQLGPEAAEGFDDGLLDAAAGVPREELEAALMALFA